MNIFICDGRKYVILKKINLLITAFLNRLLILREKENFGGIRMNRLTDIIGAIKK